VVRFLEFLGRDKGVGKFVVLFPVITVHGLNSGIRDAGESLLEAGAANGCYMIAHDHRELNRFGMVLGVINNLVPKKVLTTYVPVNVTPLRGFSATVEDVAIGISSGAGDHSFGESTRVGKYAGPFVTHYTGSDVALMVIESRGRGDGASCCGRIKYFAFLGVDFVGAGSSIAVSAAVFSRAQILLVVK